MNNRIFKSTLSSDGIAEIEAITHYSEYRVGLLGRIADYFGYVLGGIIVATPMIFGIVANVSGMV